MLTKLLLLLASFLVGGLGVELMQTTRGGNGWLGAVGFVLVVVGGVSFYVLFTNLQVVLYTWSYKQTTDEYNYKKKLKKRTP